jgi:hypothetical protein
MPELAGPLGVHDLQVADGRLAARAPVDHVASAIDEPLAIQMQKGFQHSAIERRLKGEALAGPIARGAQADHLLLDGPAAFGLPFPHAPLEFLAAEILAADALLGQLAFDHKLRGDAGMIHARKPKGAVPSHAAPPNQHIDLRMLQQMADMDRSGDVRRGQGNGKGRAGWEFSARNSFSSNQAWAQCASISCGSYAFGISFGITSLER